LAKGFPELNKRSVWCFVVFIYAHMWDAWCVHVVCGVWGSLNKLCEKDMRHIDMGDATWGKQLGLMDNHFGQNMLTSYGQREFISWGL